MGEYEEYTESLWNAMGNTWNSERMSRIFGLAHFVIPPFLSDSLVSLREAYKRSSWFIVLKFKGKINNQKN